jgi:NitT/TauT family transport system ATP-binding protein
MGFTVGGGVGAGRARPAPRSATLVADHVSRTFVTAAQEQVQALADVSLEVGQGEFVTVLGPSGCGKTTLLRILGGLIPPTSGRVFLDGRPVTSPSRSIGMVFQAPVLLPWRNVLENILVPIEVQHGDRRKHRPIAEGLIRLVGLQGFERTYPFELSGGMQQRVSICRALVHDPAVLMLDEPFGALDALTRESMNIELQRIWLESHKTVVLITHSVPEAVFLSDRVLVMSPRPGRILASVEVEAERPRTVDFMGTPEFAALTDRIRGYIQRH